MKLKNTKALVRAILEQDEKARNSDNHLYLKVIQIFADARHINLDTMTVSYFLAEMNHYDFPPFESVRRSRQKVQEECPHLAASPEVEIFRADNEEIYREFARN